jgi:hypothetical protein
LDNKVTMKHEAATGTMTPAAAAAAPGMHHLRTTCRACGSENMQRFLELGPQPLANSFPRDPSQFAGEPHFPLDVYFCHGCSLVQLLDVVDPEVLFRNYIYVTGTSTTIAAHNVKYAQTVVELLKMAPKDLVVEVASNDGSLLKCFRTHGVRTLGVEPATNIAEMARADRIETVNRFFNSETAADVRASHGPAKAVIGNNVLAHVDQTQDFLAGYERLLAEDGLAIIEVPYLGEFVERFEYDTVYHEHLCYFSVTALAKLCENVGLALQRVDFVPVHGGSIRVYAGKTKTFGKHAAVVERIMERERASGLTDFARYERFAADVKQNRESLVGLLQRLKREGKSLAAYGAPAKGNTLLNYCRIGADLVPYTVDKNPKKVGTYTPGMHLPVLPAGALLERQPDYTLILAWNFADEIMSQQRAYHERGGRFIIPIPQPRIV